MTEETNKKEKSKDYSLAKNLVETMKIGSIETIKPMSINVFRKYLTEASQKKNMKFATKPTNDGKLLVKRIKKEKIWK